jgi:ABC-type glutathione transport system ATPase component
MTKYMKGKIKRHNSIRIIGQSQFENLNEFTELGVQINNQNNISNEIRKGKQAGNRCYYANK